MYSHRNSRPCRKIKKTKNSKSKTNCTGKHYKIQTLQTTFLQQMYIQKNLRENSSEHKPLETSLNY